MRFTILRGRLLALAKNQILTEILCYSWNPEEHPRWQHLSSPESSDIECVKVISQEEKEKHAEDKEVALTNIYKYQQ